MGVVEDQEVREEGLFVVERAGLLSRVHRLYHGLRGGHDRGKGRSTSGPGGPSGVVKGL